MFWNKDKLKDKQNEADVDNVKISKDGVVSLDLNNEHVKNKIKEQILKLKYTENSLSV